MLVFVYGTLKKNEPNYHWLTNESNGKARIICEGKTSQLYPLVIASKYNIPFLCDQPGTGKNVQGEVYEIDEKMLSNLDILEEYPKLYTRRLEKIIVQSVQNEPTTINGLKNIQPGQVIEACTYLLKEFQPIMLKLPYLDNYSSYGPHNLPYNASEDDLADPSDIYDHLLSTVSNQKQET